VQGTSVGPNRVTTYIDPDGRKYKVLLPATAPESHARMGVRMGPPPLDGLGLSSEMSVRVHNELFGLGILTYEDVKRRGLGTVTQAIQSALKVDAQAVATLYYQKEHPNG
jgi:hypothetical protein